MKVLKKLVSKVKKAARSVKTDPVPKRFQHDSALNTDKPVDELRSRAAHFSEIDQTDELSEREEDLKNSLNRRSRGRRRAA